MSALPAARADVLVDGSPDAVFALFTDEIGLWWRTGTPYWNDRERGVTIRLEPYVGGRFLEVHDLEAGTGFEVGRVTAWEPGERLALTWTQVGWPPGTWTELEVTFTAVDDRTLVRLEHTGFERTGADAGDFRAGYTQGWRTILGWFAAHLQARALDGTANPHARPAHDD